MVGAVREGSVDAEAADMEDKERVDLEANLTNLSFLHMSPWALWREFLLAPLFLAARHKLRLKE